MLEPQSAKSRFWTISLLRLAGAIMIGAGMVLAFGEREFIDPSIGFPLGLFLIAIGFLDLFIIPAVLIRRWRTPQ